jgi:hypothetical protein
MLVLFRSGEALGARNKLLLVPVRLRRQLPRRPEASCCAQFGIGDIKEIAVLPSVYSDKLSAARTKLLVLFAGPRSFGEPETNCFRVRFA